MIALLMGRKFLMELERTYFHTFPTLFIVFIIVALKTINNYKKKQLKVVKMTLFIIPHIHSKV